VLIAYGINGRREGGREEGISSLYLTEAVVWRLVLHVIVVREEVHVRHPRAAHHILEGLADRLLF
jgi:hypothetical protein